MPSAGRMIVDLSATRLVQAVTLCAGLFTVAVVALPFLEFAYRAPALHVALETSNALVALLVGFLIYGRFREHRKLQELLLVIALCTVAVANLVLTAVPTAVALGGDEDYSRWGALAIRFLGTVLLVAAALVPRHVRMSRRRTTAVVLAAVAAVVVVSVVLSWAGDQLPPAVDPSALSDDASRPALGAAHPVVVGVQMLGVALYGLAAYAFTRQACRGGDELLRWVGAGCVLAAFARVHYVLYPSLYSEYVYTGDLLRLGFYVLMLVGATREISSYWALREQTAVLEDRRRMARDLHDGLTQELTYIYARSRRLAAHPEDTAAVEQIRRATGRAIDEARRAIAALTRPADQPFVRELEQFVEELALRHDVKVVTDLDPAVEVGAKGSEHLLRIVGEAFHNAVRHGKAQRIQVSLRADPLCLSITDDGHGFDPETVRPSRSGGFGMTSMRERARALGVEVEVETSPGEGTTVRVTRP